MTVESSTRRILLNVPMMVTFSFRFLNILFIYSFILAVSDLSCGMQGLLIDLRFGIQDLVPSPEDISGPLQEEHKS